MPARVPWLAVAAIASAVAGIAASPAPASAADPAQAHPAHPSRPAPKAKAAPPESHPSPKTPVVHGRPVTVRSRAPAAGARSPTRSGTTLDLAHPTGVALDLAGPLARVPEVALHRYGAPGSLVTVSLRGTASDQSVIRLGGLPLTPPGGGTVDLSLVPPSLLGSVRVTPGAQGARAGAGALGGVVDLEPMGPGRGPPVSVRLAGGSFATAAAALRLRLDDGPSRIVAAATAQTTAGDFPYQRDLTPAIPGAPWTPETRHNAGARLGAGLAEATIDAGGGTVTLTALGALADRQVPGMVGFPTPGATDRTWRSLAGAVYRGAPSGAAAVTPTVRGWMGTDGDVYDPGPAPSPSAGDAAHSARSVVGGEAGVRALTGAGLVEADLEATFEHLDTQAATAERASAAGVVSDTVWLSGDRLALAGALRLAAFTGQGLEVLPSAGLRFQATRALRLEANVGRAVRMPTLYELYADTALVRSNPDLAPETAITGDLATVLAGAPGRLRAAVYASREHDLIAYELYPPLRLRPANLRDAAILGAELDGRLALPFGFAIEGGYAFTGAVFLGHRANEAGRALPDRPPHRGLLRLDYHRGPVSAFVQGEAQAAYPRNRANTKWVPGRLLVGLGARVELGARFQVAFEVDNLLDDERLQDVYGYPLPGRTLLVSLRYASQGAS